MSKRARRLWLGDWQRKDEDSDPGDSFVIVPDEAGPAEPPPERPRNLQRAAAVLAAIAFLFALGFALSSSGSDNQPTTTQPQIPQAQLPQTPPVPQGAPPSGFGGADLTGAAAAKAAAAAVARYPGDVERVTAGPGGGGYVVHVIQADGNEVHVIVSDGFKVQGSDAGSAQPRSFGPATSQ
jgi:hypothetical protein